VVLDYVPCGALSERLHEEGQFSASRTKLYAAEILLGLGFLHRQGFVYRDLTPENIFVDRDGHLRIEDFGARPDVPPCMGTSEYLAPELFQRQPYTRAADRWTFGVLVFETLCGLPPFYAENGSIMYRMILNDPVEFPAHFSAQAKDLIGRLLEKNPAMRIGADEEDVDEIKRHAFFIGINWDALMKMEIELEWKPELKGELHVGNLDEEFSSRYLVNRRTSSSGDIKRDSDR
jgi:serine/threonine protein kinase